MYVPEYRTFSDDCVKIGVHVLEHEIDILIIASSDDVVQFDDIRMFSELLKKHDFRERGLQL